MTNIITVSESKSMRRSYDITIKRGESRPYTYNAQGHQEAAAKAMDLAISCGGEYRIFGSNDVIEEIKNGGISGDSKFT